MISTDLIWALATNSKNLLRRATACLALLCSIASNVGLAVASAEESVYMSRESFIASAFEGSSPSPSLLWLSGDLRDHVSEILGHAPHVARVRYWNSGERSAWILEEIGKERPITAGFVIAQGQIQQVKVLAYRESRGWEIRNDFFTRQFEQAQLSDQRQLSLTIDNISGATLSVTAMKKLARVALLLDQQLASNEP